MLGVEFQPLLVDFELLVLDYHTYIAPGILGFKHNAGTAQISDVHAIAELEASERCNAFSFIGDISLYENKKSRE
nr:hypothetical protein [Paenibacillus tianmuensis]